MTPEIRARLKDRKSEILAFLEAATDTGNQRIPDLRARTRDGAFPLSYSQRRLWFLDQLEGPSATYNLPFPMKLEGLLHVPALERAIEEVVARHESLRTSFQTIGGEPVQVFHDPGNYCCPLIDLSGLPAERRGRTSAQLVNEASARPFDLGQPELLRITVLKLATQNHVQVLNMHHIISDGWSIAVLIGELVELYQAQLKGAPSPLKPLTVQYADYAAWQCDRFSRDGDRAGLDYWLRRLTGAPALLELPTDRLRPAVQTFRGDKLRFQWDPSLTDGLQRLGTETGSTLFMTLHTLFAALMARYSGRRDIVVGSPVANRNDPLLEPLIGFFVNTLALRVAIDDRLSLRPILIRNKSGYIDDFRHGEIPFEQVVDALNPERSLSHSPIFQVMFALQKARMGEKSLSGLRLSPLEPDHQTAKFDLSMECVQSDRGLAGTVEFNADLFDKSMVERMVEGFRLLVVAAVEEPDRPHCRLPYYPRS